MKSKYSRDLSVLCGFLTAFSIFNVQADELRCEGPFAKDSDHTRLEKTFGKSQVSKDIVQVEADELKASIVFAKDANRRLEIVWWDEKALKRPSTIQASGTAWTGPKDIRVGMKISEVEMLNGKPFLLYGFGWDYGGTNAGWRGGAFTNLPGGCNLIVVFGSDNNAADDAYMKVVGDKKFLSSSKEIRDVGPRVEKIGLAYPK